MVQDERVNVQSWPSGFEVSSPIQILIHLVEHVATS